MVIHFLACCLIGSIFSLAICVLVGRNAVSAAVPIGVVILILSALLIVAAGVEVYCTKRNVHAVCALNLQSEP